MAEILLFHHALGCTPGVRAFADDLRQAGHRVHAPDLFEGRTFDSLDAGVAYAAEVGFAEILDRGVRAAEGLTQDMVDAGFHAMEADPIFVNDGDVEAARELGRQAARGELRLYPGRQHLFADRNLPSYDAEAAALLGRRVLAFLASC